MMNNDLLLSKLQGGPALSTTSKTVTCHAWALDKCPLTAERCSKAHYFFPIVSARAHIHPFKLKPCEHYSLPENQCNWPDEFCGYQHGSGKADQPEYRQMLRNKANAQPWSVEMSLRCKACGCEEKGPRAVERMEVHCRNCKGLRSGSENRKPSLPKDVPDRRPPVPKDVPDRTEEILRQGTWR